jgi:hypothetical protein
MKNHAPKIKLLSTEYSSYRPNIHRFFLENVSRQSRKLLDPWAGHASFLPHFELSGINAHLNDILPIHYFINQAKQYNMAVSVSRSNLAKLARDKLLELLSPLNDYKLTISAKWIDDNILRIYTNAWHTATTFEDELRVFSCAVLLLSIRHYCSVGNSSNPTWLKPGGMSTGDTAESIISATISRLTDFYAAAYSDMSNVHPTPNTIHFSMEDAETFDPGDDFDTVFTSPPYCNRLDIYRLYNPELEFLSSLGYKVQNPHILGTNVIKDFSGRDEFLFVQSVSHKTANFLACVRQVGKRRENDYYFRYFCRYFSKLFKSVLNCMRYLAPGGSLYIVVQDNSHRGILISTAEILIDFFTEMGLRGKIVFEDLRHHLGKRNVSSDFPAIIKRHKEQIVKVQI